MMAALWAWLSRLPARAGAQVRASFWALLSLDGDQQRALMTWGILGAMVAMSFGAQGVVDQLVAMFVQASEAIKLAIVNHLGDALKLAIGLIGMLTGGIVLIARGGETTIKGPGGIEISARGPAATRELARSVDVAAVTNGEGGQ